MSVVVVGSANADTTIRVEELPLPGQTVQALAVDRRGGGKGANVAHAAAVAGARVLLVAQVGQDAAAEMALSGLADVGVDLQLVRRTATPTGTAVILVDRAGENSIVVDPGANFAWDGVPLADLPLVGATVVTNFEVPASVALAVGTAARDAGARFVLNPSPLTEVPAGLLDCGPLVVVNADEARSLATVLDGPADDPQSAALAIQRVTGAPVVVTLGAGGAGVLDTDWYVVPGRRVPAVDTTGAGDAFLGVMAARLAEDTLLGAVEAAIEYAARVVQETGARLAVPARRDET